MTKVVRLQNPEALELPAVHALFSKAFEFPFWGTWDDVKQEVAELVSEPGFGMFVAGEGKDLTGVMLITLPTSALCPFPSIHHFWAKTRAAREALVSSGVDFMVANGHTRFLALNATGKSDAVWQRLFKAAGRVEKATSMLEVKIE